MKLKVNTSHYEFAHGKKPRGRGLWAFDFRVPGSNRFGEWQELEFAPKEMTFADATKWAQKRGAELSAFSISVAS